MRQDLPEWLQLALTYVTGKPYQGQKPGDRSAISHILGALMTLAVGIGLSMVGLHLQSGALPLVPLGWLLTTNGARKLRLTIMHFCSHNAVFSRRAANFALGETISILTLNLSFKQYQHQHIRIHHGPRLLQPEDETFQFFEFAGFKLGMSVPALWLHLWKTLVSPVFHLRYLALRLQGCFLTDDPKHNALALAVWLGIFALGMATHNLVAFGLAYGVPVTVLLQISSLLQNCVIHRWPVPAQPEQRHRRELGEMTVAVFIGEATPQLAADAPLAQKTLTWGYWTLRMLFYHLPTRALVMMGDIPCHDYHHRHPGSKEWPNYIFARQADLEAGSPGWPEPYQETWGLLEAIDETFKSLSQQPPLEK
jgi:fatty acid desaturase